MSAKKTIYCKTANIVGPNIPAGKNLSVADIMRDCHRSMDIESRREKITFLGDYLVSQFYVEEAKGIFIHIVRALEGSPISIVPKPKPKEKSSDLKEMAAPATGDFLQKECFVFFSGDMAIYLNNGIAQDVLAKYLTSLATKGSFIAANQEIRLFNLADKNAIARIRKYGVKSLRVSARMDEPTWRDAAPQVSGITEAIRGLIFDDPKYNPETIGKYYYDLNLNVANGELEADKVDPLTNKGAALYEELEANEISGVGFNVILKNGDALSLNDITLSKEIHVDRHGSSLDKDRIKMEIIQFKKELVDKGFLNE